MTFDDWLHTIGEIVAIAVPAGGVMVGLSGWLGKVWANRLMAAEMAKHNCELERLRAEIRAQAFQLETRFAKLHEKRAEVIVALFSAAKWHLTGSRTDQGKYDDYRDCEKAFYETFERNEIYFPEDLCKALHDVASELRAASFDKTAYISEASDADEQGRQSFARIKKRIDFIFERVPELKRKLKEEFRRILGVHDTTVQKR